MISAFSSLAWRRAFSRSSWATRAARGLAVGLRPRRLGSRLCACRARQFARCEEYNPSRRNSAPIAPGDVQRSASRMIRRLYSALNRRRAALAVLTSGSGRAAAAGADCAPVAIAPFAPSAPAAAPLATRPFVLASIPLIRFSALYSNSPKGKCLTVIGTEGNRVRHPTDWSFTSRCFGPHLLVTPLRLITGRRAHAWRGLAPR